MKFCQRCGEEIMDGEVFCPGCGCTVAKEIEKTEISYAKCVKIAATTAILSAVAIVLGIICWLLINMWVGVISKEDKEKMRTIKRNLKSENPAYKFSTVLAVIAVVLVVVFALSI